MSNQPSGSLDTEQEWERKRYIQHAVLRHLHETGPMNWSAVYVRFDRGDTGEIGAILRNLAQWQHISVEIDGNTKITEAGREWLFTSSRPPARSEGT
jgi:hypothetical protein